MDDLSDTQLLDIFAETGGVEYYNMLVTRHIRKVRSVMYGVVMNDADADDLTQEVFIRLVDKLPGFERKSSFSTWLYRIAVNTAKDFLRKKRREPVSGGIDFSWIPNNDTASPASGIMTKELDSRIGVALESLAPRLRTAVALVILEGMSVREAASVEKCSRATMYWRIHQARKILEKSLNGGGL